MILVTALTLVHAVRAAESLDDHDVYFGELHCHTGYSSDGGSTDLGNCNGVGCGDFSAYFDTARYDAGLDFAAITDHVSGVRALTEPAWLETLALVEAAHDPAGGFVALLGAEIDFLLPDDSELGHKNAIFFGDDADYADSVPADFEETGRPADCDSLWDNARDLSTALGPLVLIPHHPAASRPAGTDWTCHDPELAPLVEIYSGQGNSRDLPDAAPYDPLWSETVEEGTVNTALITHGYPLGFVGGTDFHDTLPGMICHEEQHHGLPYSGSLTAVVLDAGTPFDRAAVHDALVARHTFATSGPMVPTILTLHGAFGLPLGEAGDLVGTPAAAGIVLRVSFPASFAPYVTAVEVYDIHGATTPVPEVTPGTHQIAIGARPDPWFAYAVVTVDGASWWADQGIVCLDGGVDDTVKIWTSPVWTFDSDAVDDDGDGFTEADGDCDDGDATISPGVTEVACDDVDNDCDGALHADEMDDDGDGLDECGGDCDDADPTVRPLAPELLCDHLDNDCDGALHPFEEDGDLDGWDECDGDCDDCDPTMHPGAVDHPCDGIDSDCDGDEVECADGDDDDSADGDDDDSADGDDDDADPGDDDDSAGDDDDSAGDDDDATADDDDSAGDDDDSVADDDDDSAGDDDDTGDDDDVTGEIDSPADDDVGAGVGDPAGGCGLCSAPPAAVLPVAPWVLWLGMLAALAQRRRTLL